MLRFRWGFDKLWPDNVTNAVCDKNCGRGKALLGMTGDVGHANRDDQADDSAKCARDGIPNDWCRRVIRPFALPDQRATSNDWKAADYQHHDANVRKHRP